MIADIDGAINRLEHSGCFVDASTLAPCDLDEIAALDQGVDRCVGGGAGHADQRLHSGGSHDGGGEELLSQTDHRVGSTFVEELVAELVLQLDEADGPLFRVAGLAPDASKEERDPGHEVAILTGDQQVVVVLATVLLERGREIEERLGESVAEHEHQWDEQATDPAVTVEERMDDLELVVSDGQLDEQREVTLVE